MYNDNLVELSDSNELVITLRAGYDTQFKITSWQDGLQFFTFEHGNWLLENVDAGILLSTHENMSANADMDAVEQFANVIPYEIRQVVLPFHYKQFSLLRLAAQYPQLRAVLIHSPNLCWLVVAFAVQRNYSLPKIVQILQLKRVQITELLFDNKSMQLVKLINKIQLVNGSEGEAEFLFKVLKNTDIVNGFKHWKNVSICVLRVVYKRPMFINSKLLINEINELKSTQSNLIHFASLNQACDDLQLTMSALNKTLEARVWLNIESEAQLKNLHDKWVTRYNHSEQGRLDAQEQLLEIPAFLRAPRVNNQIDYQDFEPLPFKAIDFSVCSIGDLTHFIQIKNSIELSKEGIYMNHCVGSYGPKLVQGESYIYKLLQPERATVEVKVRGDKILVTQFKLANNRKPSAQSYEYLREIMSDYELNKRGA